MKYTLTFPDMSQVTNSDKVTMIRILRQICPCTSLREAKDIVDKGATRELDFAELDHVLSESLSELRRSGVEVTELNEPEVPTWRPVMTDTLANLRKVAIAALDRGEHDIAIAVIELIKKNSCQRLSFQL